MNIAPPQLPETSILVSQMVTAVVTEVTILQMMIFKAGSIAEMVEGYDQVMLDSADDTVLR
jgi:hypothetical protein